MKTPKMHEVEGEASVDEGPSSGALTVGSRPEMERVESEFTHTASPVAGSSATVNEDGSPARSANRWARTVEMLTTLGEAATLISVTSGLLVFFGSVYTSAFFSYFGVANLLGYSVEDQLKFSADVLFGAVLRAVVIFTSLAALDYLLLRRIQDAGWLGQRLHVAVLSLGVSTCVVGALVALGYTKLSLILDVRLAALLLIIGAVVVLRALHLTGRKQGTVLWRLIAALILLLALFWSTALYAYYVGQQIARQVDEAPTHLPVVTLFTRDYLDIPGNAVAATRHSTPDGSFAYRYSGMRMLLYSNNRWFLLTGRQDLYRSTIAIIQDDSRFHIEISKQQQ